jgi:hypothetical protein
VALLKVVQQSFYSYFQLPQAHDPLDSYSEVYFLTRVLAFFLLLYTSEYEDVAGIPF